MPAVAFNLVLLDVKYLIIAHLIEISVTLPKQKLLYIKYQMTMENIRFKCLTLSAVTVE